MDLEGQPSTAQKRGNGNDSAVPGSKKHEIAWLQEHHPELLDRALRLERNPQAKLTSVKGLGRSYSWDSYVRQRMELPLFESPG